MCNQTNESYEYGSIASSSPLPIIDLIIMDDDYNDTSDDDFTHYSNVKISKEELKKKVVCSILFGQVLSLLLATSAAANSTLYNDCNVSLPTTQTFIVYCCLFILHVPFFCNNFCSRKVESSKWFHFILPAFLDVEANYLCVLAFRYTSLTSVTILDAFAIPSCMLFSKIMSVRKRPFYTHHYVGVALCSLGLLMTVFSDGFIQQNDLSAGKCPLLGDTLALVGGIVYGLNDTVAEKFVKNLEREKV